MHGIDSALRTNSSHGTDSTLEPIPCNSNSGSFGNDSNMIPVPGKNGIITPLISTRHPSFHAYQEIRTNSYLNPVGSCPLWRCRARASSGSPEPPRSARGGEAPSSTGRRPTSCSGWTWGCSPTTSARLSSTPTPAPITPL